MCCLFLGRLHFQIDWSMITLSVTAIGLVIVLFTKQRTTACLHLIKNKKNPEVYVLTILFVAGFVTVVVEFC